ncbi:CfaE/CblD family pilus tip adhesin [Pantoea stewartii]|uniref:CfaE/CblD family pilus tip adhesin n=1 Tax=Pantoea stewartii TaxID=66269 RepID=UPI001CF7B119
MRRVSMPGVPCTSLCVPAPLTLTTPKFRLSDKSSGHYSGMLRIVYTPTTQTGS